MKFLPFRQTRLPTTPMWKFRNKKWGYYKKWEDPVYVYFTKIENSKKIFNWYETSEFNIKRLN